MKRTLALLILKRSNSHVIAILIAFVLLATGVASPVVAHNGPDSVADLAEQLLDAVVNISTTSGPSVTARRNRSPERPKAPEGSPFEEFFDDFFKRQQEGPHRPRRPSSLGSGFVIDASGVIVTNNHVIEGADEITINFDDGKKLVAEVVGHDPKTDLAVLKVESDTPLPFVEFGSSDKMRVGDWVMAIGNPFGLSSSVSVGIVSARNRDINSGPYDNFIQTDAAINKGNSGGPLFNKLGEVIGINTAIFSPSGGGSVGVGFSVPSDTAVAVISQLREFGETRRGWLGVRIQPVNADTAESASLDKPRGALVVGVTTTGPAEKAGVLSGDIVIKFNGRDITEMKDLPRIVADTPVGKSVEVVLLRKGKEVTVHVDLGRLEEGEKIAANETSGTGPEAPETGEKLPDAAILGMKLAQIDDELRKKYNLKEGTKGLVITSVDPSSQAAEKKVQAGDVVMEMSQEIVSTLEDVTKRIESLKKQDRELALFLLSSSDGSLRFVALKLEE